MTFAGDRDEPIESKIGGTDDVPTEVSQRDFESETSALTAPIEFQVEASSRLGRYEIKGRIGIGGMGEVYRAYDPLLERTVAIKVISQLVQNRAEMLERFSREARAASALNHPNIITVYDLGQHDGHPFIVMEFVEGETLQNRMEQPLSVEQIVRLGGQIVDGLAAAHEAGIVHRDLKPGNILIDRRDTVRILDFGVAAFRQSSASEGEGEPGDPTALLTSSGEEIVGTVGYMAPELLRGESVDHRADQFALGIVLYEMATGRRPFRRPSRAQVLVATLEEEPEPISALRKDLPPALRQIIERCLQKQQGKRYDDTSEILNALQSALSSPQRDSRRRRGQLPTPVTPLQGRDKELDRLRQLLRPGQARLVTLTGVGGSGKTRLAIEAAREAEAHYPGGVVFVPLGTIQDPDLVTPSIAAAFGGTEAEGGHELPELLASQTEAEGPILLVLDNFEQVIDAAPQIGQLLERCPLLTMVVTSREVLHLRAEHGLPVAPLGLPPRNARLSLDEVREAPAVALFLERAKAVKPDFELTEKNVEPVLEFCRRLDGLPLALELAAARVRTLPLAAMLQRLQSRMELLTGGPRDLPARQQTLRATIHWSYELLDEVEQAAFRRLSAFVGGFTLEAAEAVVDPFGNFARPVVDLVESLHDQSLLIRLPGADEEPRFSMLETIHDYGVELSQGSSDNDATRKAHAAYYLILAEEGEAAMTSGENAAWLERFQVEEPNFRAALDWLASQDEADWGLRMALGLFSFWEMGEGRAEGARRLEQLLELPSAQADSELRAKGLFAAAVLSGYLMNEEDQARIIKRHEESLAISRRLGSLMGQAVALNALGIAHKDSKNYDAAATHFEECMQLWRKLEEDDAYARSLSNYAYVLRLKGELEQSRKVYRESIDIFRRLGDTSSAAWEVSHEAGVARDQNDPETEQLYQSALAEFRRLEEPWGIATTLLDLGLMKQASGDLESAGERYREALDLFCRVGHQRGIARVFEILATLAAEQSDHERVLKLAGAAEELRRRLGNPPLDERLRPTFERAVEEAREQLAEATAKDAWQRGREESVERLVKQLCGNWAS